MQLKQSVYKILHIASISLTNKTHPKVLFNKSNISNVNERFGYNEQRLFFFETNFSDS